MKFKLDENFGRRTLHLFLSAGHDAKTTSFPPDQSPGIAVVRIPRNPTLLLLEESIRLFLNMLAKISIENNLWIIETHRIRIHQSEKN